MRDREEEVNNNFKCDNSNVWSNLSKKKYYSSCCCCGYKVPPNNFILLVGGKVSRVRQRQKLLNATKRAISFHSSFFYETRCNCVIMAQSSFCSKSLLKRKLFLTLHSRLGILLLSLILNYLLLGYIFNVMSILFSLHDKKETYF